MRERFRARGKGCDSLLLHPVKLDFKNTDKKGFFEFNVIYLSNCLIKLKGGDKSREKIIDTCKIMR